MTVASRPRRRSRPSLVSRVRRFWLIGIVFALLLLAGGFALASAPIFRLHELSITGLTHVARRDVVARAAIDPHANVWLLDRASIARRIEELPYVATAHVHRRLLGNVWLEIAERAPDGCVRSNGGVTLTVDRDDRVLERGCVPGAPRFYELRTATDLAAGSFAHAPELAALQNDARALGTEGDRFQTLRHDAFGGLEAELANGVWIRFGDDRDLDRKRKLIAPILAQLGPRATTVLALDLRAPATPVVQFRPPPPPPKQVPPKPQYTQGTRSIHHNM